MTKLSFSALAALVLASGLLGGCMAAPAEREGALTSLESCRARCNRQDQICADESAVGRGTQRPVGGAALCQSNLQACLARCGTSK
jgi:hypothetical protein